MQEATTRRTFNRAVASPLSVTAFPARFPGEVQTIRIIQGLQFRAATEPAAAMVLFSHALPSTRAATPTAVLTAPRATFALHGFVARVAIGDTARHGLPLPPVTPLFVVVFHFALKALLKFFVSFINRDKVVRATHYAASGVGLCRRIAPVRGL